MSLREQLQQLLEQARPGKRNWPYVTISRDTLEKIVAELTQPETKSYTYDPYQGGLG